MQNQFQTEEAQPHYQTPAITPPQELVTKEATEQQEQAVTEFVAKIKKRVRRNKYNVLFSLSLLVLTPLLMSLIAYLDGGAYQHIALKVFWLGLGSSTLYALYFLFRAATGGPGRDIKELARVGGIRAIGPLIEMREGFLTDPQLSGIFDTLTELLPRLQSGDANLLTRRHRDFLNAILTGTHQHTMSGIQQENLRLAILEAWKHVGDARAIPIVQRLANPPLWQKPNPFLQQAARECLPLLKANLAHVLSTQTLLRASAPEPAGTDTLLRPAAATTEHAPAELLRAANSDTRSA